MLKERISNELLPFVRQPAQYIGGEINQLVEPGDWQAAEIRVAIGFPDAYTIGMSHLGCQILYWLCNQTPGVCAERTYAPWIDAERIMRERDIPLFTWDTRQPVASADIFAISLQYELCFTTVLNMLDLAGIPVRHADRMKGVAGDTGAPPVDSKRGSGVSPVSGMGGTRNAPVGSDSPSAGGSRASRPPYSAGDTSSAVPQSLDPSGPAPHEFPLVIVGGPQADNPEPMAEFVDLVVLGDGEESMAAILEAVREYKRAGVPRRDMIERIARRFPWVYAPNLYDVSYHDDGTVAGLLPRRDGLPTQIERCRTPDFDDAPFPERPLVPWTEAVHDRISIEIMRGCPQVCRFCHAGYTKRPLHYRTPDRIVEIAEHAYWATGHHEVGLLSLSTADYPLLRELADKMNARFGPRMVNLSFPSLRIDKMLQNIPWMANGVRKGGITMAVEAARDDMRRAIRKKVTDGSLLEGVREVYRAGWNRVKLYFMAGFPGEREDDIDGIWELANAVSLERCALGLPPGQVTASVGWLVPKPFTPLQWMAQPRREYFEQVRTRLRDLAHKRGKAQVTTSGSYGSADEMASERDYHKPRTAGNEATRNQGIGKAASQLADSSHRRPAGRRRKAPRGKVSVKLHDPRRSILEAVFARGDRRLDAVILEAWRRGARFDGWDETYDDRIWQEAFAATGVDPDFYAHRERHPDEVLPWDHVGLRIGRPYLEKSYDDVFEQIGGRKPLPIASQS